jgi:hypothetical protein
VAFIPGIFLINNLLNAASIFSHDTGESRNA